MIPRENSTLPFQLEHDNSFIFTEGTIFNQESNS